MMRPDTKKFENHWQKRWYLHGLLNPHWNKQLKTCIWFEANWKHACTHIGYHFFRATRTRIL